MANATYHIFSNHNFADCTLVQFGWEQCKPLHSFGPAKRSHYLFHYILSGKGTFYTTDSTGNTQSHTLHAGQGFLIFPDQTTHYVATEDKPWEYVWIEFDGLKSSEFIAQSGLTIDCPIYNSSVSLLQQAMKDELLYIANHGTESSLSLIGHLYLFLDAFIGSSSRRMTLVGGNLKNFYAKEAMGFIQHNFEKNITVEDIAKFCNLNRTYFGKIFKEVVSINPQEFLIQCRMTKACEYLETTNFSIGEVSSKVGYVNQLHFSRAFRNVYKMSPRDWKATHKQF